MRPPRWCETAPSNGVLPACAEQSRKATADEDKAKVRWLDQHLRKKALESLSRDMIERIARAKQKDGCSNATVDRTLALMRAILRKCGREWQWLDRAPTVRMLKEPTPWRSCRSRSASTQIMCSR